MRRNGDAARGIGVRFLEIRRAKGPTWQSRVSDFGSEAIREANNDRK